MRRQSTLRSCFFTSTTTRWNAPSLAPLSLSLSPPLSLSLSLSFPLSLALPRPASLSLSLSVDRLRYRGTAVCLRSGACWARNTVSHGRWFLFCFSALTPSMQKRGQWLGFFGFGFSTIARCVSSLFFFSRVPLLPCFSQRKMAGYFCYARTNIPYIHLIVFLVPLS